MKFKIYQKCDYVCGHLRYGHLQGEIEADSKEELEKRIKENPKDIRDYMEVIVDEYEIEDCDVGDNKIEIIE